QEIVARPDGPLAFRFYLQPIIAALLAFRDGHRDALAGRPPYFWGFFKEKDPKVRKTMLRDGWRSVGKVATIALLIDVVYEIIVLHGLRPVQSILVAIFLALLPYTLLRGPVNRLSRGVRQALHREPRRAQRRG
ncbi:MAG: hypothetical protein ACREMA_16775, partial [Longimicrobiales bacterium]